MHVKELLTEDRTSPSINENKIYTAKMRGYD